jgi:hypothetical protein
MPDAAENVALLELGQVEAGAEMLAVAGKHDRPDVIRQGIKKRHHALHQSIVEGVAFLSTMQPQHGDSAAPLGAERRWQRAKIRGVIGQGQLVTVKNADRRCISMKPRQGAGRNPLILESFDPAHHGP